MAISPQQNSNFLDKPETGFGFVVSADAWRSRYTLDEQAIIDLMSIDNPNSSTADRLQQAKIRQVLKTLDMKGEADLADADFLKATMETCKLLERASVVPNALERFNSLVNEPVQWKELPNRLKEKFPQE